MIRFAVTLLIIAGCATPSSDPTPIAPDVVSAAASNASGVGGSDAVGGAGGDAASASSGAGDGGGDGGQGGTAGPVSAGAGAGSMGYGGGSHSESGTRLKVTWYEGGDGSRIIRPDVYDSELGFYCRMAANADHQVLPIGRGRIPVLHG
jgi:hypothetical protein